VAFWRRGAFLAGNIFQNSMAAEEVRRKLAVVGVTSEPEAEIAAMRARMEFASVLDPKAELCARVGVTSIPYVMLVDPEGCPIPRAPTAITEKQVASLLAKRRTRPCVRSSSASKTLLVAGERLKGPEVTGA